MAHCGVRPTDSCDRLRASDPGSRCRLILSPSSEETIFLRGDLRIKPGKGAERKIRCGRG